MAAVTICSDLGAPQNKVWHCFHCFPIYFAYCHPAYLTYMQNISWETLGWKKHKLDSRLPGEISITSDMQVIPPLWQKVKRNWKASWWKWKWRVKKLAFSSTFRKRRSWHLVPSLLENRWGNSGNSVRLYFLGSKITADGDCTHEIKRRLLLGRKVMTNLDNILRSQLCQQRSV